jgi:hypothetical protein
MVTTRSGVDAPPPTASPTTSPTKRATRASKTSRASTESIRDVNTTPLSSPEARLSAAKIEARGGWAHTPSNLTLIWLAISLPLVIWDTAYVMLRPHSMPGGKYHEPIWKPYGLYSTVDYVYGFKALEEENGWTAAQVSSAEAMTSSRGVDASLQGCFNVMETIAYLVYLYLVYAYGQAEATQGRGAPDKSAMGPLYRLSESRTLTGKVAAYAVLLGYSTASLTFFKTVLYCQCHLIQLIHHFCSLFCRAHRIHVRLCEYPTQFLAGSRIIVDHSQRSLVGPAKLHDVRFRAGAATSPRDCCGQAKIWKEVYIGSVCLMVLRTGRDWW